MLACRTEFYPNDRFFAAIAAISLDLLRDRSGHRKKIGLRSKRPDYCTHTCARALVTPLHQPAC